VLIPALVEPDRSYDAVLRAGDLLNILNKYGFHLILHGHKHWPCTFTVDNRNGYDATFVRPILIVAGGSVGSRELPKGVDTNCYNRILVKWNSDTDECRVQVDTRGLIKVDDDGRPFPTRSEWYWKSLRVDDRTFYRHERVPASLLGQSNLLDGPIPDFETQRQAEYVRLRGNLPVVEVRPSFQPFQKYEAVFWIVPHNRKPDQVPVSVTWSAGPRFPAFYIPSAQDPRFRASYAYYGPMLIQATLEFKDGNKEHAYIYCRFPSGQEYETR
jgi:hypothetical protein